MVIPSNKSHSTKLHTEYTNSTIILLRAQPFLLKKGTPLTIPYYIPIIPNHTVIRSPVPYTAHFKHYIYSKLLEYLGDATLIMIVMIAYDAKLIICLCSKHIFALSSLNCYFDRCGYRFYGHETGLGTDLSI